MHLQLPAIRYHQGNRMMLVTAMDPISLVKTVQKPDTWNPLGNQPHGNRPQDKKHREGIAEYLEDEENFVLGSVVLYANSRDAKFEADADAPDNLPTPGTLYLSYGAQFDVGDGQHRIGAYSDVIKRHEEDDDPVLIRLRKSGQPAVIVIDDSPLHRAQDFTDLQRNAKPPTGSLALSMDRRQPVNRMIVQLVQNDDVPIFDEGRRIEFLKDSPGKYSTKLFSFKTVRYMSGTALIGVKERSTKGWESAINETMGTNEEGVLQKLSDLWRGIGQIPDFANVISGKMTVAQLREKSLLAAAGIQYAIAYAIYVAHVENKVPYFDAAKALGAVNFDRPKREPSEIKPLTKDETPFAGTLIDPMTGKVGSGRPAWEAAARELWKQIMKTGGAVKKSAA